MKNTILALLVGGFLGCASGPRVRVNSLVDPNTPSPLLVGCGPNPGAAPPDYGVPSDGGSARMRARVGRSSRVM